MRTCIIHIGMHKTGSTSIQKSLYGFSDAEFHYAALCGAANHSVAMFSMFSDTPERHKLNRDMADDPVRMKAYLANAASDLDTSIRACGRRTLIISGEDIIRLRKPELKRMRERLSQDFGDIRIVAYVRPPLSYITSAFQQRVRSGGHIGFDLHQVYPNYRKRFSKFDEVFGRDRVALKLFDRRSLTGGDAVVDFCSTLGLNFPKERIINGNESWSRQSICLIFQYNRYCSENGIRPLKGSEARKVMDLLSPLGHDRFYLSPALLEDVISTRRKDIAWMELRLGAALSEPLGSAHAGDISSEEDLLMPVPGAHEALRAAARRIGLQNAGYGLSDLELLNELRNVCSGGTVMQRLRLAYWRAFGRSAQGAN